MATPKWGIPTMAGTDAASTIDDTHNSAMTSIDDMAKYTEGTFAARPAAATAKAGKYYRASDQNAVYLSDGTTWRQIYAPRPAVYAYNSAAQSIPNNVDTAIALNTETYDNLTSHDTVTNNSRVTLNAVGLWLLTGQVSWSSVAMTGSRIIGFVLNTVGSIASHTDGVGGYSGSWQQHLTTVTYVSTAVQYAEFTVSHNQGSAVNVDGGGATYMNAIYLGPLNP